MTGQRGGPRRDRWPRRRYRSVPPTRSPLAPPQIQPLPRNRSGKGQGNVTGPTLLTTAGVFRGHTSAVAPSDPGAAPTPAAHTIRWHCPLCCFPDTTCPNPPALSHPPVPGCGRPTGSSGHALPGPSRLHSQGQALGRPVWLRAGRREEGRGPQAATPVLAFLLSAAGLHP